MLSRQLSLALVVIFCLAPLAGCDDSADATVSAEDCQKMDTEVARFEAEFEEEKKKKQEREAAEREAAEREQEALAGIQVELPASPDFEFAKIPLRWEDDPDNAYSIYGLREDIDHRLKEGESGQMIVVKGWVQEIYVPPTCPVDQLCPPAKQPHFWITDNRGEQGKKRALMVVSYEFPIPEWDIDTQKLWEDQPRVIVELDKQYTVQGEFKRFSDTGFAHDNGLLEFHAYKAPNPDPKSRGEMIWIFPPNADWHPLAVARQEAQNAELRARARADEKKHRRNKRGG